VKKLQIRAINPNPGEPAISKTFRIRKIEDILGGQDMNQHTHRHDFYFILALKKGMGNHVIDFTSFQVTDNCIFILRPGQVHQLELRASSTGYLMELNMEFYQVQDRGTSQTLRKATTANFCKLSDGPFDKLHALVEGIYQEYTKAESGYQEIIRAQLDIFFIQFVRNRVVPSPSKRNGTTYEQERLEQFLDLIEGHCSSKKQVSDYTEMLNLSAYQLSAITKGMLGKTPSELIDEHIILESKRYLLGTADQVNQIAGNLGFDDPSYFIRFFKKHTGYSPEAFRTKPTRVD
jgi:AraC-like DNA-binding protein/mannose-6-phosphate isomerase-like protein (cupin superfamily)